MDDRNDTGAESASEAATGSSNASAAATRIGLDVGTSKVVTARGDSKRSDSAAQLNAFLAVPYTSLAQNTLQQQGIPYYRENDELIVYGSASEKFAHMFNAESRRPMAKGILNPREPAAAHVLEVRVRIGEHLLVAEEVDAVEVSHLRLRIRGAGGSGRAGCTSECIDSDGPRRARDATR